MRMVKANIVPEAGISPQSAFPYKITNKTETRFVYCERILCLIDIKWRSLSEVEGWPSLSEVEGWRSLSEVEGWRSLSEVEGWRSLSEVEGCHHYRLVTRLVVVVFF